MDLYKAGRRGLRTSVVAGWARLLLGAAAVVVIGRLVDGAASGRPLATLLLVLAGLLLARAAIAAAPPLTTADTAIRVESDLRRRILGASVTLGPASGRRTGETVSKATEGIEAVGALAGTFLPQLVVGMSGPLLLAAVVATIDLPTAMVLLLVVPLIPALLRILEKRFASVSARYRETADMLAARFLDGIQGLRTLKTLDVAEEYGEELKVDSERLRLETMRLLRVNQLALLAVDTLFTLGTVVAASLMAVVRLSGGAVTLGEAVAIVLLGVMLIEPLTQIGRFFYVGAIGRAAARQVRRLLGEVEGRPAAAPAAAEARGVVELDAASFTYPDGTRAVDRVTFRVSPGETVALVGPSGAGKTTIAHLVTGLLEPDEGTVRVGGRATLVPQRPFLFHGTLADNLRLARPDASDEELARALEAADLGDLLAGRREGLDTPVGERGLRLSGGEAQRLAMARSMLVDSAVVVMDEPTSNIDLESEARVRSAVRRLTRDRTVLIIAHRRSTIAGADRVLLIDGGRLAAQAPGDDAEALISGLGAQ